MDPCRIRRRIFFRHLDQHEGAFGTLKRQESRCFAFELHGGAAVGAAFLSVHAPQEHNENRSQWGETLRPRGRSGTRCCTGGVERPSIEALISGRRSRGTNRAWMLAGISRVKMTEVISFRFARK